MNPVHALLSGPVNKSKADRVVEGILVDQYKLEDLMNCFFSPEMRLCQSASWAVTRLADQNPELMLPYLSDMVSNLENPQHDAVIRNTLRTWQFMDIPEEFRGIIYDVAFELFADPKRAVAIRVFSMSVCTNIAVHYPELVPEIKEIILEYWDHSTAAWRGRGKQELKRLDKLVSL